MADGLLTTLIVNIGCCSTRLFVFSKGGGGNGKGSRTHNIYLALNKVVRLVHLSEHDNECWQSGLRFGHNIMIVRKHAIMPCGFARQCHWVTIVVLLQYMLVGRSTIYSVCWPRSTKS
jgi:hypothetical protein